MRRGTTPTHIFTLSISPDLIKKLRITYAQHNEIVLVKTKDDVTFDGNTVRLKLTQEETLKFREHCDVEVEFHVLTVAGESLRVIRRTTAKRCVNDEVLE